MDISKQKEVIDVAKDKMHKALLHLEEELKSYRAGKANPAVFNNIMVDYYGNPTPIPQVASVTTPDAKTMLIQPWDKKMIPMIEKAIMVANIGFTPSNNGEHVRINVPPLTEDRRKDLVKRVKAEGENAKISVRNARRDGVELLKK
jgi:ribosome recycling factor